MPIVGDMLVFFKKRAHPDYPFNDHDVAFCLVDKLEFVLFYRRETPVFGFYFDEPYASVGEYAGEVGVPVSCLPDGFLHVAAFEGEFVDKPALDTVFTPVNGRWFDDTHV